MNQRLANNSLGKPNPAFKKQ